MDCSPAGSSVHGILQTRILEWVAMPFSRGFSQLRDWTWVSFTTGRFFTVWAAREAPKEEKQDNKWSNWLGKASLKKWHLGDQNGKNKPGLGSSRGQSCQRQGPELVSAEWLALGALPGLILPPFAGCSSRGHRVQWALLWGGVASLDFLVWGLMAMGPLSWNPIHLCWGQSVKGWETGLQAGGKGRSGCPDVLSCWRAGPQPRSYGRRIRFFPDPVSLWSHPNALLILRFNQVIWSIYQSSCWFLTPFTSILWL